LGHFTGLSAVSLYGPILSHCKHLTNSHKAVLVGCPAFTGAILRLIISIFINNTGGKNISILYLFIATMGIIMNYIMIDNMDLTDVSGDSGNYILLLIAGMLAGAAIGVFPMVYLFIIKFILLKN